MNNLMTEVGGERHELLEFLSKVPVGLVHASLAGDISFINSAAAGWLTHLAADGKLQNIFSILLGVSPGLHQTVQSHERMAEAVVDNLRFEVPAGHQRRERAGIVSMTLTKTGGNRLMAVLIDVTESESLKEALRTQQEHLLELVAEQTALLDNDLVGIVKLRGNTMVWTNKTLEQIFAYGPGALANRPFSLLFTEGESYRSVVAEAQSALQTVGRHRARLQMRRKDGAPAWLDMSCHQRSQALGESIWFLVDITSQKQVESLRVRERELEAENRAAQEASRFKSEFLASMSHELRTPLNAVIGFADLMHSGRIGPDPAKHKEFLGHIGTSGRHLLQLINDVLDLSKVESGKFDFFPEHVDLWVLLKEVREVLHPDLAHKNICVSIDIDHDLIGLTLDPVRLKQVLYNYLSNAIKFTPAGGQITVRAMTEGPEHFRIEVEDSGIGISVADLPTLFSQYGQIGEGRSPKYQGTGLGLALTRQLVEAQGGRVGVRSTVGVGSVFSFTLNRTDGWDTQRAEAVSLGLLQKAAERVLVIGGELHEQGLLADALSGVGLKADAVVDERHALKYAHDTAYAALTLDLSLSDGRGLDLLDAIRSIGASNAAPVISFTCPADTDTSVAFAIANVLCKPIRSDEILSAMDRFKSSDESRANVMVIDHERSSLDLMSAALNSIGIEAVCFQDGCVAMQEIDRHKPDAIVIALLLPEFDCFQVLDTLRRRPDWREVPVFIWTRMSLTDGEYATLARSARAVLLKGGGTMDPVLGSLRRWRKPVVARTWEKS